MRAWRGNDGSLNSAKRWGDHKYDLQINADALGVEGLVVIHPDKPGEYMGRIYGEISKKKDCPNCKKNVHPPAKDKPIPRTWLDLLKGVVGLTKAELGFDPVAPDTLTKRKDICKGCSEYDFGVCKKCGCYLAAKTAVHGESCPLNKW